MTALLYAGGAGGHERCADHSHPSDGRRVLVGSIEKSPPVNLPAPRGLELENVMSPRGAFFGRVEQVPVGDAAGRIAAEMVSP
jgi:hypothetical protein